MSSSKYDALRAAYPKFISKDQLRKICKISPMSALYLIKHGIIPVVDTGKQTWRYKICLEDVIDYLEKKKKRGSMIPLGAATHKKAQKPAHSFASLIRPGMEKQVHNYFSYISEDYPDTVKVSELAEISGMCKKTILQHIKLGYIKHLKDGNTYIIPKELMLNYLSGSHYINAKHNNEQFERIWGGFQIWLSTRL